MKNKKSLLAIMLVVLFGIVGGTVAYYQTTNTFSNVFNTGKYKIVTEETFESPPNWKPGDNTPKEFTVKNEGDVPAAVKVCLEDKWEDKDGNELLLIDDLSRPAVLLNYNEDYQEYWKHDCDETKRCYYYHTILEPNEETTPLLESVIYNLYFDPGSENVCTTDQETHVTTCTSTDDGYSGGKYTLDIKIETVQANKYKEVWGDITYLDPDTYECENFELRSRNFYNNTLRTQIPFTELEEKMLLFGTPIERASVEKLQIVNNKNIPNNALGSYDVSYLKDESVLLWYTDVDNDDLYEVYIGANGNVVANPNSKYAFSHLYNLESIDLEKLDISNVTNMRHMFDSSMSNINNFDFSFVSNWDVSKVTNMDSMFNEAGRSATTWTIGDLSNWNTGNVKNMRHMFQYAGHGAQNFNISYIANWDVSNVVEMDNMFTSAGYNSSVFNVGNLSNWDTRNVKSMHGMFQNAGYYATTWNSIGTLKVYGAEIGSMFFDCRKCKATINLYGNPQKYYDLTDNPYYWAFRDAVTSSGALITVNYTSDTTEINNIIATKSSNSNVVKGSIIN